MKAVVFDLDGTLIDSAPDLHAAAVHMLKELGKQPIGLSQTVSFIGNGVPNLVRRCLDAAGLPPDLFEDGFELFEDHYLAHPTAHTIVYPGARDLLAALKARETPIGLCTNKPSAMTKSVLADLALESAFDVVVAGDTLATRKPDPAPLLHTLSLLGVAVEDGLYVGDSVVDAETAAAASVDFALFAGGYPKGGEDRFPCILKFDDLAVLQTFLYA
jgi:phosphoglycolate phosphatase